MIAEMNRLLDYLPKPELSGKRIFVTGGTGFFGNWLLATFAAFNQRGINLQATLLSRNPDEFLSKNPGWRDLPWLNFVVGDIQTFSIPSEKFDFLIHGATETVLQAHQSPRTMLETIYRGTENFLKNAERASPDRLLLISSGAVYGAQTQPFIPESAKNAVDPLRSDSAYGEGKRIMELLGSIFQSETGIDTLIARCFTFCGPGLPIDGHFAAGNFVRDALYAGRITVNGNGTAVRSYLYGADLAVWLMTILVKGEPRIPYNVGSDRPITIRELAHCVRDVLAPEKAVEFAGSVDAPTVAGNLYVPAIESASALGCKLWTPLSEAFRVHGEFLRLG